MSEHEDDRRHFIRVRSSPDRRIIPKERGFGKYSSEARKKKKKVVENRNLNEKLRSVTSSVKRKTLRDLQSYYMVIELTDRTPDSKINDILNKAYKKHTYINKEHTKILASMSERDIIKYLKKGLPFYIQEPIQNIRELNLEEQIGDYTLDSLNETIQPMLVHLIPNLLQSKIIEYYDLLNQYCQNYDHEIIWKSEPHLSMVLIKMNKEFAQNILQESNIIYKIEKPPKGIVSKIPKKNEIIPEEKVAYEIKDPNLPTVCVLDSGVDEIPQLEGIILGYDCFPAYEDPSDGVEDEEGHGTPISYLTAFGEAPGKQRANIISYKIYSDENPFDSLEGMIEGITKYSKLKIMISSINFEGNCFTSYAKIDKLIQENNVCFVSPTGNIEGDQIELPYPQYFNDFFILHPAQNPDVISVGGLSFKEKNGCSAKRGEIAPITRCIKSLESTYDIIKPDFVEHGGNWRYPDLDSEEIGVSSYTRFGERTNSLVGTSFSAPLIAGKIAEIYSLYGSRINNIETIKALLFICCTSSGKFGFGNGYPSLLLKTDKDKAILYSEGTIPLSDLTPKGEKHIYYEKVRMIVPKDVNRIDLVTVHSDNYHDLIEPRLDTYIKIEAEKDNRRTYARANNYVDNNRITNVKRLFWEYKARSMGGIWTFNIIPDSVNFFEYNERNQINVRYGCAILLNGDRQRTRPLADDVRLIA